MKEKIKCKNCKLLIDKDVKYCPYCGYDQDSPEPIKEKEKSNKQKENKSMYSKKAGNLYFHRENGAFSISNLHHALLLIIHILGLNLLVLIFTAIFEAAGIIESLGLNAANAILTLTVYPLLLIALLLSLWEDFVPIVKTFKNWQNILYGIAFGAGLIGFSYLYNYIIAVTGAGTSNENQQQVETAITLYPVACVFVLGIIGPICEELTYRLGLYGFIRKKNMWAAVIVSSLLFGLIHFNFGVQDKEQLINELLNLPSYIISGAILGFAYEKGGLASSCTAHIMNNFIATLVLILS